MQQLTLLRRHEAQGCTMRGALKRRSTRQQTPTAIGACDDPYTQHSKGTMKQERLPMPGTETSPSVKQPTSSYDMPIKTDGFDTPSLFFPLQRDFEFEDRQQPWSPPATSDGPYGVGQQDVACNGYIPASCYISALDVPL